MQPSKGVDREHLKLLSIFHYVVGGMTIAISMFFLLHIGLGLRMISDNSYCIGHCPENQFGWMVFAMGLAAFVIGLGSGCCLIFSGVSLAKRKRYWFSVVVACVECLYMPLGTILGILTLIVLYRATVRSMYGIQLV